MVSTQTELLDTETKPLDKDESLLKVGPSPIVNGVLPITVDLSALTIGDLETLDRAGKKDLPTTELIDFLEKVVIGGVRHLPLIRLGDVIQALGEAVSQAANPTVAPGELGN